MQRLLDYVEIEGTLINISSLLVVSKGMSFFKVLYKWISAAGISFHTDSVDLAYQILNVEGQLLFLMQQQKLRCTGFIVYSKKSFENVLYDIYGNKVLKFIGPSVFMSKMTSVSCCLVNLKINYIHIKTKNISKSKISPVCSCF